jgi:hypothetical protein
VTGSASGRIAGVFVGPGQRIGDADLVGPAPGAGTVEGRPLDLEHAEHVEPPSLRDVAARPEPAQLPQDDVLGRRQVERHTVAARSFDAAACRRTGCVRDHSRVPKARGERIAQCTSLR